MNFIQQKMATLRHRATELQTTLRRWALFGDEVPSAVEKKMMVRLVPGERATFEADQELSKERLRPVAVQLKTLTRWYDYVLEKINEQFESAATMFEQGRVQECMNVLNDIERRMLLPNEETLGFVFRMLEQHAGHEYHHKVTAVDAIVRDMYLTPVKHAHQRSLVAKETMALTPVAYFTDAADGQCTWRQHARLSMNFGRALPLSMIGVPRNMVSQPWNLVAIAHEVGLCVYSDIQLNWEIVNKLRTEAMNSGVSAQTTNLWARWHETLFADIFATLKLGPAYVSGMIELLGSDPSAAVAMDPNSAVPPVCIRWSVMIQALNLLKFEYQARELQDQVQMICGDANQISQYGGPLMMTLMNECRAVTGVIAFSPCQKLAGARVIDIVGPFLSSEQQAAEKVRDLLLDGDEKCSEDDEFAWTEPLADTKVTAATVLAGLRLAFDASAEFETSRRIWVRFWCLCQHLTVNLDSTREREDKEFAPGDAILKSMAQKSVPTFVTSPIDRSAVYA